MAALGRTAIAQMFLVLRAPSEQTVLEEIPGAGTMCIHEKTLEESSVATDHVISCFGNSKTLAELYAALLHMHLLSACKFTKCVLAALQLSCMS